MIDDTTTAISHVPTSKQIEYPLLKPIAFTNIIEDDYINSGVWMLK